MSWRFVEVGILVFFALPLPATWAEDWARESREMATSLGTHISREPTQAATYREIAVRLAKDGDIYEAKRVAQRISYEPSRAAAFGEIALIQAKRDPWNVAEAKRTANRITYKPYRRAAYREIARRQAAAGNTAEAKRTAAHVND